MLRRLAVLVIAASALGPGAARATGAPPAPTAHLSADRTTVAVGAPVTLGAHRSHPPAAFRSARFSWGDGTASVIRRHAGDHATHRYSRVGTFTASVAVTDVRGHTLRAHQRLRVIAAAVVPPDGPTTAPSPGPPSSPSPLPPPSAPTPSPAPETPTPHLAVDLTPVTLSLGAEHACRIHPDGSLWCSGGNDHGQLGDGTQTERHAPVRVDLPPGSTSVSVSAGDEHTCAVLDDHRLLCWGSNDRGQLGDGTTTDRVEPTAVVPLLGRVVSSVAAGAEHTCAAYTDGEVACWGLNHLEVFADGLVSDHHAPALVPLPAGHHALTITAGGGHTCALLEDQELACWGTNSSGELGVPRQTGSGPFLVPSSASTVAVAASNDGTCALRETGQVLCWHGTGNDLPQTVPVGHAVAISAGGFDWTLVLDDGAVLGFGDDRFGQHGDGRTYDGIDYAVNAIAQLPAGWRAVRVATGGGDTCAVDATDELLCWGSLGSGQLGLGTASLSDTLVAVALPPGRGASDVAASGQLGCAVLDDRTVDCWGLDAYGDLGAAPERTGVNPVPGPATLPPGRTATAVTTGAYSACALLDDAHVACWGRNDLGQVGNGHLGDQASVSTVALPGGLAATAVSSGAEHSCALLTSGQVACWGSDGSGELGDGARADQPTPVLARLPTGRTATSVSAGTAFTCASLDDGEVACWGTDYLGQLGDTGHASSTSPVLVPLPAGRTATAVDAGDLHACARLDQGGVACWGDNFRGELGNSDSTNPEGPHLVTLPAGRSATAVSAGNSTSCAVLDDGSATCWGPTQHPVELPPGRTVARIEAGTCAVLDDGGLGCLGDGALGQLGNPAWAPQLVPVASPL